MEFRNLSVVVPVCNSEATLELGASFDTLEIILVNDGSRDNSWHGIVELAAADSRVRGMDLVRNYDQHNALLCGIQAAKYEVIVTMDDDLQHPSEEIPKLLDKLAEGYDVVLLGSLPGRVLRSNLCYSRENHG